MTGARWAVWGLVAALSAAPRAGWAQGEPDARVDFLTFANGAMPLSVSGSGTDLGMGFEQAIEAVDGNPRQVVFNLKHAAPDTDVVFVYELPALTTFDYLAIPEITETPSPSRTFFRQVEVDGSATGPDAGFERLATATLTAHRGRGEITELTVEREVPVRWVRLRLQGPIEAGAQYLAFSELIGHGTQEPVAGVDRFTGVWGPRTGLVEMRQEGPVVTGCADDGRKTLDGTVTGSLLRATLVDLSTGVRSALILGVEGSGALWGLRSDNGAPFRLYTGPAAAPGTTPPCTSTRPTPTLGCGSVIHGIRFAFDSADLLPEAAPVLDALYAGLAADPASAVRIVGHTSSEGSEAHNQSLSERRAAAVVAALEQRGIRTGRLTGEGRGESQPIASNDDEAGRILNRRVEVECR